MILHDRLQSLYNNNQVPIETISNETGLSHYIIMDLLDGIEVEEEISARSLKKLATVFGTTIAHLIGEDDDILRNAREYEYNKLQEAEKKLKFLEQLIASQNH